VSSYSRVRGSHFRLLPAAPRHCPKMLPLAPSLLSRAPSMLPPAPSLLPLAPSLLPLKRPCSLSRSKTVIARYLLIPSTNSLVRLINSLDSEKESGSRGVALKIYILFLTKVFEKSSRWEN